MSFIHLKRILTKIALLGAEQKQSTADSRITILSNVLASFGTIASLVTYFELVKLGFDGQYLLVYFLISAVAILVLTLNYFERFYFSRILVVILLNLTAWNALVFYGKSFNGYYVFFVAIAYSIVAFHNRQVYTRWITLGISCLGLPLTDYLSHSHILPITHLNSDSFSLVALVLDSVTITTLFVIIVLIEKSLSEKYEDALNAINSNLESLVEDRTRDLNVAKEDALAASRAKTQFVANISHELRTPLAAIIGFVELISDADLSEKENQKYLKIIWRNAFQLSHIIDEVLDLSKIEAKKLKINREEFLLESFLEDIRILMTIKAEEKGLAFEIVYPIPLPKRIVTDPLRLKQILVNLIGNAIKFTEHGEVRLTVNWKALAPNKVAYEFDIEDTGIGIYTEDFKHLFKPFSQTDASLNRKFGGTGLGLSLSKDLASLLDGELTLVNSKPNMGTGFRLTLNCFTFTDANDSTSGNRNVTPDGKNAVESQLLCGKNILVVDDSEDNQLLVGRYLESAGAQVQFANNGQEALNKFSKSEDNYSAVLMDLQMPVLDGYETTRIFRKNGYKLPIIALTAGAKKAERDKALFEGFSDYLTKPIQRQELILTIRDLTDDSISTH